MYYHFVNGSLGWRVGNAVWCKSVGSCGLNDILRDTIVTAGGHFTPRVDQDADHCRARSRDVEQVSERARFSPHAPQASSTGVGM